MMRRTLVLKGRWKWISNPVAVPPSRWDGGYFGAVTRHFRVWLISGCASGTNAAPDDLAEGRRVTLDRHGPRRLWMDNSQTRARLTRFPPVNSIRPRKATGTVAPLAATSPRGNTGRRGWGRAAGAAARSTRPSSFAGPRCAPTTARSTSRPPPRSSTQRSRSPPAPPEH